MMGAETIITRKEASDSGLIRYFTGKPCVHGHIDERNTATGSCMACHREDEVRRRKDPAVKEYHKNHGAEYRKNNRDKFIASYWRHREKRLSDTAEWKKRNGWRCAALEMKRKAAKRNRTPSWADFDAINFFYECRPSGCHVDHVIPMQGKNISGFHVETNLQWMPAIENMRKGNSWN